MANIQTRVRAAIDVFKNGYTPRVIYPERDSKAAPFVVWPEYRTGTAQWHLVDLDTYIREGYTVNSLIYSAVRYKAYASTQAPLRAYRGDMDNPELLPPEHPLARLTQRPNPSQSWSEYQLIQTIYLNLTGDTYGWLDRKGSERGVPSAIYAMDPRRVFVIPNAKKRGKIGYLYVPEGGSTEDGVPMLAQDVMHVKLPNPLDQLDGEGYGLSPLSAAARSADVDNMITEFLQIFFQRGAVVSGLLKYDVALDDNIIPRIRERWSEIYGGFRNWGENNIGILDRGGSYERVQMGFQEMGFEALDERNETRILSPFGVPPILIGSRIGLMRSTYSNYEEARRAFWEDTMVSEMRLFEDDYKYYLQSDDGGFVAMDFSQVPALRVNVPELVNAWTQLVQNGVPKERAAAIVGLEMGDLPDGDIGYMPLSFVPVGSIAEPVQTSAGMENAEEDNRTKALPVSRDNWMNEALLQKAIDTINAAAEKVSA